MSTDLTIPVEGRAKGVCSDDALSFVTELHRRFEPRRQQLLKERAVRQAAIDAGERPAFLPETSDVRTGDWQVADVPADLQDRRTEITGPTDRKMVINALNSGAKVFMADFEDSNAPTWANMVEGQANLSEAIDGTIELTTGDKHYALGDELATLMVRPRGWHLNERHVRVDGEPVSGSLFDFGMYFFHNHARLAAAGSGPYFYLPKLEGHLEARLWNDVFTFAQAHLGVRHGTIKATVLIEHILAAFEMEEILYELRDHSSGLNAGRWDYIFSMIKTFRRDPAFVLPDRAQVTMTVPFMRAYTELLVRTCHRRGAHAIGGMAAFIPSRRDAEVNEAAVAKVREDKRREATDGCDGTWIAHPDLVSVALDVFDDVLGERPNQRDKQREDVSVEARDLLDVTIPGASITEAGLRTNLSVGVLYIESWLRGQGAAALYNMMEDAATAEISRTQVWQWIEHAAELDDGRPVTHALVSALLQEEVARIRDVLGAERFANGRFDEARSIFEQVATAEEIPEFLTLPALAYID